MTKAVEKPDLSDKRSAEAISAVQDFLRKVGTPGIYEVFEPRLEIVNGVLQRNKFSLTRTGD